MLFLSLTEDDEGARSLSLEVGESLELELDGETTRVGDAT